MRGRTYFAFFVSLVAGWAGAVCDGMEPAAQAFRCWMERGHELESQGRIRDASEALRQAVNLSETADITGIQRAVALNDLGVLYRVLGRLEEAEALHLQSIPLLRRAHAPELAAAVNNLAQVRAFRGDWKAARELFQEAIRLWEEQHGPDNFRVATGLSNLAIVLESRGKFAEAERLLERALTIYMQAEPRNPRNIGVALNNLGTLAAARKRYPMAASLFEQALGMLGESGPAAQPDRAEVMANLADMWKREGRLAESAGYYRESLEILSRAWGADNPRLLKWLDPYAAVLRARQEFGEAERVRLQATRIRVRQTLGKAG